MDKRASLQRLRALADRPTEQAAFAQTLLDPKQGEEVVQTALKLLTSTESPLAKSSLVALYQFYQANSKQRDASGFTRAAILRALRPLVRMEEVGLLQQAVTTYLFPPPSFKEEAAPLRSAALLALNEVDETLAGYHAARLLVDEHTDKMSGEPALSAAQLLSAQHQLHPMYAYVSQSQEKVQTEVVSECLRNLTALPPVLLAGLLERYGESPSGIVLVGLYDLLIDCKSGVQGIDYLKNAIQTGRNLEAYRYLVTRCVTCGNPTLRQTVKEALQSKLDEKRKKILSEALEVLTR